MGFKLFAEIFSPNCVALLNFWISTSIEVKQNVAKNAKFITYSNKKHNMYLLKYGAYVC